MDYKGQMLSENLYYWIIILFGAVAWVVGFLKEDFYVTVLGWGAGVALATLLCVPDWPWFNRNPITWLESVPGAEPVAGGRGKKVGGGGKKKKK